METKKNTRDLYLAAVFMALGAKYEGVDRTDPKHQVFTFIGSEKCKLDNVEKEWINGDLMVNAVAFKDAVLRMKGIIYST